MIHVLYLFNLIDLRLATSSSVLFSKNMICQCSNHAQFPRKMMDNGDRVEGDGSVEKEGKREIDREGSEGKPIWVRANYMGRVVAFHCEPSFFPCEVYELGVY